jgi:hypothetical protein
MFYKYLIIIHYNVGLGRWKTVSVKVVDEEEELAERERLRKEEELTNIAASKVIARNDIIKNHADLYMLQARSHKEQLAAVAASLVNQEQDCDSALMSFDPYNTGVYKGISVRDQVIEDEVRAWHFSLYCLD